MGINLLSDPYLLQYYVLVIFITLLFASTFFIKALRPLQTFAAFALLIIPVVYFYLMIDAHTVNVPYIDDYDLLKSIHDLTTNVSFTEKIKVLFSQINQHRFAYERVVMWLILLVTGSENIKLQIVIGNLFLLGILYLFFKAIRNKKLSWYYLIPVNFLLFNLVYYENANWGIAAIQNTSLIFFAFFSAYSLGSREKGSWYLAIFAALLASFTSGSGLLTWIIGCGILLLQKRFRKFGAWVAIAISVFLFYFLFDYKIIGSSGESFLSHPIYNLSFLLAFWGNALYLDKPHPNISGNYYDIAACIAVGFAIGLIFFAWLLRFRKFNFLKKTDYFLLGALMFAMGTGAMLVLSRPIDFYITYGGDLLSRRYMIFGVVLLSTAYLCVLIFIKNSKSFSIAVGLVMMILAVTLNFVSYFMSTDQLRKQYELLSLDGLYWKNEKMLLSFGDYYGDQLFWNHPTMMKKLVSDLSETGIYRFPASQYPSNDHLPEQQTASGKLSIDVLAKQNWSGKAARSIEMHYISGGSKDFRPAYFQLKSADHTFLFPALPKANILSQFISVRQYYGNQYDFSFFSTKILPGNYEVSVVEKMNQNGKLNWKIQPTGKYIAL